MFLQAASDIVQFSLPKSFLKLLLSMLFFSWSYDKNGTLLDEMCINFPTEEKKKAGKG